MINLNYKVQIILGNDVNDLLKSNKKIHCITTHEFQ